MAAMMGKEWGGMGQNYLRSLLALGFQAFLIIVCVAIYAREPARWTEMLQKMFFDISMSVLF